MPMDDVIRLMTFDFALEQLRQNLKDLAQPQHGISPARRRARFPGCERLRKIVRA